MKISNYIALLCGLTVLTSIPSIAMNLKQATLEESSHKFNFESLGELSIFPLDIIYEIIDQGLPATITTIEELEQVWQYLASLALVNKSMNTLIHDEHLATLIAKHITRKKADEFWMHYQKNFKEKLKDNQISLLVVHTLISAKADVSIGATSGKATSCKRPNDPSDYSYWYIENSTFLAMASCHGYKTLVKTLLTKANPQIQNPGLALHWATSKEHIAIVTLLLSGGSIEQKELSEALLATRNLEIAQLLIDAGANVNYWKGRSGVYGLFVPLTPLVLACRWRNKDLATLLLKAGARPNGPLEQQELSRAWPDLALSFSFSTNHSIRGTGTEETDENQ